jgi:long-chain fatty acid transport protein
VALGTSSAFATNGDNLIGIGPISRAMGGTGIAAPQDAISAVFANPAAMCFTPGCDYGEVNFGGTLFAPKPSAEVDLPWTPGPVSADSKQNVYAIPAIGISLPIDKDTRRWRFGLAAYGVTGLGVDYRSTALEDALVIPGTGGQALPGAYTSLQIMKFAPSLAYQITPNFSVGGALHIDYATLDLRNGSSPAYGVGAQFGLIYKPFEKFSIGANVVTPQKTKFREVVPYQTPTGPTSEDLTLEAPLTVGAGVAYSMIEERLLLTAEGRWLNWGDADGYSDFDWEDQWVAGAGAQFAVIPKKLFLRLGYNYGANPVRANNGWTPWNGATPLDETNSRNVQGLAFPNQAYESFRILGFPAIVEHHLTAGLGYAFSEKFEMHLGYMHGFENTISESSAGGAYNFESTLSEDSLELGFTWRF